ncbi:type I secretion system permease/ATPase [Vibrio apostichopi]|uniref:type I secretion system permease/ATPase n=1 Tax=Vibrio apostichopi TaxID=3035453 RepID=UPI002574465E|nr:type I secretion system permease/ATPase [Vibrio sp. FE10]
MVEQKDSWLGCVEWLCEHFNVRSHPSKIVSGLPLDKGRLNESLFPRAIEKSGLTLSHVKKELLTQCQFPVVAVNSATGSPVVVTQGSGGDFQVLDCESNSSQETSLKDLVAKVESYVWQVGAQALDDARVPSHERSENKSNTRWLWRVVKEVKPWYRDLFIASFLINLLALVVPLFTMNVYDRVVPNQAFNTLWVLAAGVGIVVIFDWVLRSSRSSVTDMAGRYIDNKLSSQLFSKVLGMKLENRPQSVGAFARQLQDFDSVKDFFTSISLVTLVDLPFTLLFLFLIGWLGGAMMFIPVAIMLVLIVLSIAMKGKVEKTFDETARLSTQRQAQLFDCLTTLPDIKQNNAEGITQKRWEQTISSLSQWQTQSRHYSNIVTHSIQSSQQIVTITLIIFGVYQISEGLLSMGGLIAVVMLSGRAASSVNQLSLLLLRFQQTRSAVEGLNQIMDLPQEESKHQVIDKGDFDGGVRLDEVTFTYPETQSPALKEISLEIKPGERVGLVGAAGAGKTTLLSIVARQYLPTTGQAFYQDIDGQLWPTSVLRSGMGWVGQTTNLIFGSVYDNVTLGATNVDEEKLRQALQQSGLNGYMGRLSNGLETPVGEGGRLLSGGQRQAVAIARALYRCPKLLIMDEPTSALDNQAEIQFFNALQSMPRETSMLISSHKSSFLMMCDRVIVLDKGQIVAEGEPKDILSLQKKSAPKGTSRFKTVSVVKGGRHE